MRKNSEGQNDGGAAARLVRRGDRLLRAIIIIGALPLFFVIAACSSGGGKGSSAPPEDAADIREDVELSLPPLPQGWETDADVWAAHEEFQNQPGLGSINADKAYARGITGKGQIIGFVDTGLDDSHAEFADKTIRLNDRSGLQDADASQLRHGTGVASIALGGRGTGSGMHGVAFDADPAMWSLRLTNGYLSVNDEILSRGISALQGAGARIINHSWGYSTALNPTLHGAQTEFLETSYGDTLALMRRRQAIHVWAAGNEGHDEIAVSSAWPVLFTHREFSLSAPQRPLEVKLFYQADDWRLGMRLEKHAGLPKTFSIGVMKRF